MKIKNFITHTRPIQKKHVKQTIKEITKQIKYLKAIGKIDKIEYYNNEIIYLKRKLNES